MQEGEAPARLQLPPAGSTGGDPLRNPFDAGVRLLSQPAPGESATESPDGAVPLLASGPRA
eukprot:10629438-Alexandrium_andersonii.AAC.1